MSKQTSFHSLVALTVLSAAMSFPGLGQSLELAPISPAQSALVESDGEIVVQLNRDGCDTGHQAACTALLQRSELVADQPDGSGDRVTYSWDIMVPEDFTYDAPGGYLRAVRFIDTSGQSVFSFLLDGTAGYTVGRKVCFGPDGFGSWHTVRMQVSWDATKRKSLKDKTPGDLHVFCDGVEVLARTGRPNIGAEEEVRFSLGMAGALKLLEGDKVQVRFRNVQIDRR